MKKLMIAAAAAAMIGGVQAVPQNWTSADYTFIANFTTTTGASAQSVEVASTTWRFGDNGGGLFAAQYWYNDATVANLVDKNGTVYTWKAAVKDTYPNLGWTQHVMQDGRLAPALTVISANGSINTTSELPLLNYLLGKYGYGAGLPSNTLCCELTAKWYDGGCYRVSGANYSEETVRLVKGTCCTAAPLNGQWSFRRMLDDGSVGKCLISLEGTYDQNTSALADHTFMTRFGQFSSANANLLETYAQVINLPTKAGYHGSAVLFNGWLAGQGSCDVNADDGNELVVKCPAQIQGNIVGWLNCSLCDVCCDTPLATRAFACLDTAAISGIVPAQTDPTAAYGTFYLNRTAVR